MSMPVSDYIEEILKTLHGQISELHEPSTEDYDWEGSAEVLDMYERTSGSDRDYIIGAIRQIIGDAQEAPRVLAQLVHIAASLDIAQVEPEIKELKQKGHATEEPLHSVVTNYLSFRKLRTHPRS